MLKMCLLLRKPVYFTKKQAY